MSGLGLRHLLRGPRLHPARVKQTVVRVLVVHHQEPARRAGRAERQGEVVDAVVVHPGLTLLVGIRVARVVLNSGPFPTGSPQAYSTSAKYPPRHDHGVRPRHRHAPEADQIVRPFGDPRRGRPAQQDRARGHESAGQDLPARVAGQQHVVQRRPGRGVGDGVVAWLMSASCRCLGTGLEATEWVLRRNDPFVTFGRHALGEPGPTLANTRPCAIIEVSHRGGSACAAEPENIPVEPDPGNAGVGSAHDPDRSHHRRLGLLGGRGHPGRPQGHLGERRLRRVRRSPRSPPRTPGASPRRPRSTST